MQKVQTPVFRVAFPNVFEAKAMPGSNKLKYTLTMLFTLAEIAKSPIEKKKWADMKAVAEFVAKEKWPKGIPAKFESPFKDGKTKQEYDGYGEGVVFLNTSTQQRPGLVDTKLNKITDPTEFYGGCYAIATVNPYAWEYMGKSGVSFGLQNIQKIKDGEPFGGRSRAEEDFGVLDIAEEVQETGSSMFD